MVDVGAMVQEWGTLGGAVALTLTNVLTAIGTYRTVKANARKTNAEAHKIDAEAQSEAAKVEAARTEFERMLNERSIGVMDALDKQVAHLSDLVEAQTKRIQEMEGEIKELRVALDKRTIDLHRAQNTFPPVCKKCEFFHADGTGCDRSAEGKSCKYDAAVKSEISVVMSPLIPAELD